jgi:hypothetical protein
MRPDGLLLELGFMATLRSVPVAAVRQPENPLTI